MLLKLMKFYSANFDEQITIFFTVDYEILLAVCSLIKLIKTFNFKVEHLKNLQKIKPKL